MGARIGSVAMLLLLVGLAQYCQASRDQSLQGSGLTSANTTSSTNTATTGAKGSNTEQKKEAEEIETADEALDEFGHVKFENLRAAVQEGVLDGPAPMPASAFSVLPTLLTPALALSVSFAVLAAKAL